MITSFNAIGEDFKVIQVIYSTALGVSAGYQKVNASNVQR